MPTHILATRYKVNEGECRAGGESKQRNKKLLFDLFGFKQNKISESGFSTYQPILN